MTGAITWEQIAALIFIIGAIGSVWLKLHNQSHAIKAELDKALAEYKLHVAETFVTKQGLNEQTDRLMRAIEGLGVKIDRTNERMDQAFMPTKTSNSSRAIR